MPETSALAGRLTEHGHELRQRVYFEDTDFSGRVYHARYLHFMERGRSDYLRLLGVHHGDLAKQGCAFAVRHIDVDFLRPAAIDDVVSVRTTTREVTGARIVLQQGVWRRDQPLAKATVTIALIGPGGRAIRLPSALRGAFRP